MRVIVSDYSSAYEWITTVETKSLFLLKLKYQFIEGYSVWAFPTLWMSGIAYKWFKKSIYKGTNVKFEKFVPGTDQITHHSPWDNCR